MNKAPSPIPGNCENCGRALDGTRATTRRLRTSIQGEPKTLCRDVETCSRVAGTQPDTPATVLEKSKHARAVGDLFKQALKR
jgi:hypothetical protein